MFNIIKRTEDKPKLHYRKKIVPTLLQFVLKEECVTRKYINQLIFLYVYILFQNKLNILTCFILVKMLRCKNQQWLLGLFAVNLYWTEPKQTSLSVICVLPFVMHN